MEKTPVLGYVLLSGEEFKLLDFIEQYTNDWDVVIEPKLIKNHLVFELNGVTFTCSHIADKYSEDEILERCQNNPLWPQAEAQVKKHKSYIIVAVMNGSWKDRTVACTYFSKVAASMAGMKDAVAIYNGGSTAVISPEVYRKPIDSMKEAEANPEAKYFPVEHWIYTGLYKSAGDKNCAFTKGMKDFGVNEFEVLNSELSNNDIYKLLINISFNAIVYNIKFRPNDALRFNDEIYKLELSEGVKVEGESFKVHPKGGTVTNINAAPSAGSDEQLKTGV